MTLLPPPTPLAGGAKPKLTRPDLVPSTPPNYGEAVMMGTDSDRKAGAGAGQGAGKRPDASVTFESPTHSSGSDCPNVEDASTRTEVRDEPFATEELQQKLREMDVKLELNQR